MPISCNAVGDIIALVQLGIKIAEVLSESRKAPADCRALCNDLLSLERLIALSSSTIDDLQNSTLRQLVDERLDDVSRQILDGLKLVCKFDAAFDVSVDHRKRRWRQNLRLWAQSVTWAVKRAASARDARLAIAQSFTSLIFALLVAFQADQRGLLQTLRDAHDASVTHLQELAQNPATEQINLRTDISEVKSLFGKLLVTLDRVREDVARINEQLERNLAKTSLDMAAVRQQLHNLQTTVATVAAVEQVGVITQETVERVGASTQHSIADAHESIERLDATVRQSFTIIAARFASGNQHQCDQCQLAAQITSNPFILAFIRLIFSQADYRAANYSTDRSSITEQPSQALVSRLSCEVTSPPVIAATFFLALRANTSNERATYATLAFLLFLARKMAQLYKTPTISHVIFVFDMFDVCMEINFSNATSSASLHHALVSQFNGRLGDVLLKKRKYELRPGEQESRDSQRLPGSWKGLLKPGDRISMDALVEKPKDEVDIICPACSTRIADRTTREEEIAGWIKCTYCPTAVRLSNSTIEDVDSSGTGYGLEHREQRDDQRPAPGPEFRNNGYEQEYAREAAALRQCRRIHVLESASVLTLDTQCGVINDRNLPCRNTLKCETHNIGAKRAVQGRSRPYDELLLDLMPHAHQASFPINDAETWDTNRANELKSLPIGRISAWDFIPPNVTGLSKREARLVHNRAAAFLSRQRKREEFDAMEKRIGELEAENLRLRRSLSFPSVPQEV